MRKVCLVWVDRNRPFDYIKPFKHAFLEAHIEAEIVPIQFFMPKDLTPRVLREIKTVIRMKKDEGQFVIFSSGYDEVFLKEPDWSFVFSHYKSWYGKKCTVIPPLWTFIRIPNSITPLEWTDKPAFRIGFMGSSYSDSRAVKVACKLPLSVKKWLLRGHYLKYGRALARLKQLGLPMKYINTFPRSETLKILDVKKDAVEKGSIEIFDTRGPAQSEQDKARYVKHLEAMTYIICPRGAENYSWRVYEALKYGRIPVIIDTDMVLPTEIGWDQVAIRIPYDRLNELYDIILSDYCSRSTDEFIERQRIAFSTMIELESMRWLTSRLRDVVSGNT